MPRYEAPKATRELPIEPRIDQFGHSNYSPPPAGLKDNAHAPSQQLTDIPRYIPQHKSEGWPGKFKDWFGKLFWYLTE